MVQIGSCGGVLIPHDLGGGALCDDTASQRPGTGTQLDDPVRGPHGVLIMLDNEHGVAQIPQTLERADEALVVGRVEADAGLIQHIEDARETGPYLSGQADALGLAAGEAAALPIQ